jgi:transcriptional regulator with XRE-family HTH domain
MTGIDSFSGALFSYPFFDGGRADQWFSEGQDPVQEVVPPSAQADPALFSGDLDGPDLLDPLFPDCDGRDESPDLSPSPRHGRPLFHPISSGDEHVQGPAKKVRVIGGKLIGAEGLTRGELIWELSKTSGLTQGELSRRTGIPQPKISRYQGDKAAITREDSAHLADVFGITDAKRFYGPKKKSVVVQVRKICSKQPEEEKGPVVAVVEGKLIGAEGLPSGLLLRAVRKAFGLTQKQLGSRTNLSKNQVCAYEKGASISLKTSKKFANYFGIDDFRVFCSVREESTVSVENGRLVGADELKAGAIVRALRNNLGLTPSELSERIGGVPGGHAIVTLETTNRVSQQTAQLFAQAFGLENYAVLLPKKPDVTRSTFTTRSQKRKRSN